MTTSYRKFLERSQHGLRRILRKPAWDFNRFVADPRQRKGSRWKLPTLMRALLWGFLTNRGSLRAVESLTECGFDKRIPDSTLYDFVGQCSGEDVADLRRQLHAQVRTDWRSKSLEPVGLPCGVVAVDNKTLWTGPVAQAHDPHAQVVHPQDRPAYAQVRAVRAVLLSAASKPAIDQVAYAPTTNEGGMFPEVLQELEATYAALIEIYSLDAGLLFASQCTADRGGTQRLYPGAEGESARVVPRSRARAWGHRPNRNRAAPGSPIKVSRSAIISIAPPRWKPIWTGAISNRSGEWKKRFAKARPVRCEREHRYYLTNLHLGRLKPEQILYVVRATLGHREPLQLDDGCDLG